MKPWKNLHVKVSPELKKRLEHEAKDRNLSVTQTLELALCARYGIAWPIGVGTVPAPATPPAAPV